jgi:lysophospholipase L1-like esterase
LRSRSQSRPIHAAADERIVVAALGDSITEGSPGHDSRRGGDETSQWEYWAARLEPRLAFRNCGIYGQRTDEIMTRLDDCARDADVLIVQGGINDIAQGRSIEVAADNLRAMVRRGKELGLRVALIDVLPWNNGWPVAEPQIRRLNALIAELASDESIRLLRFHDMLEDPDRPGRMRADCTSDGDHPSVEGYRRLGEVVARLVDYSS